MNKFLCLIGASVALSLAACVSTVNPTTGAKVVDWPATVLNASKIGAPMLQSGAKICGRAVARNNPSHITELRLTTAAAAALFDLGAPTSENFQAAILRVIPKINAQDAADLADALAGGWASIDQALQQKGIHLSLTTLIHDPSYKQSADLIITSVVNGFNAGIAGTAPQTPSAS